MTSVLNVDTIADKAGTGAVGFDEAACTKNGCYLYDGSTGTPDCYNTIF